MFAIATLATGIAENAIESGNNHLDRPAAPIPFTAISRNGSMAAGGLAECGAAAEMVATIMRKEAE